MFLKVGAFCASTFFLSELLRRLLSERGDLVEEVHGLKETLTVNQSFPLITKLLVTATGNCVCCCYRGGSDIGLEVFSQIKRNTHCEVNIPTEKMISLEC